MKEFTKELFKKLVPMEDSYRNQLIDSRELLNGLLEKPVGGELYEVLLDVVFVLEKAYSNQKYLNQPLDMIVSSDVNVELTHVIQNKVMDGSKLYAIHLEKVGLSRAKLLEVYISASEDVIMFYPFMGSLITCYGINPFKTSLLNMFDHDNVKMVLSVFTLDPE